MLNNKLKFSTHKHGLRTYQSTCRHVRNISELDAAKSCGAESSKKPHTVAIKVRTANIIAQSPDFSAPKCMRGSQPRHCITGNQPSAPLVITCTLLHETAYEHGQQHRKPSHTEPQNAAKSAQRNCEQMFGAGARSSTTLRSRVCVSVMPIRVFYRA